MRVKRRWVNNSTRVKIESRWMTMKEDLAKTDQPEWFKW